MKTTSDRPLSFQSAVTQADKRRAPRVCWNSLTRIVGWKNSARTATYIFCHRILNRIGPIHMLDKNHVERKRYKLLRASVLFCGDLPMFVLMVWLIFIGIRL